MDLNETTITNNQLNINIENIEKINDNNNKKINNSNTTNQKRNYMKSKQYRLHLEKHYYY
jgi:hypothetical protein